MTFDDLETGVYYFFIVDDVDFTTDTTSWTIYGLYITEDSYYIDEFAITAKITESTSMAVYSVETPANDPIGITVEKVADYSDDIWELIDLSIYDLSGAQFTICYYDTTDKSAISGMTPKRTWVIETKAVTTVDGSTVYFAYLSEEHLVDGSSELYYDDGFVVIPVGIITVEETKVAEGYTTVGGFVEDANQNVLGSANEVIVLLVNYDGTIEGGAGLEYSNAYTKSEVPDYVDLTLYKSDGEGNALENVSYTFEIYDSSLDDDGNENGFTEFATLTTDETGYVNITNLVYGTYRITEIKTNNGYTLLAEPYVFTIDADTASLIEIHVTETITFDMPMTGDSGFIMLPIITAVMAIAAIGCYMLIRRRRYSYNWK